MSQSVEDLEKRCYCSQSSDPDVVSSCAEDPAGAAQDSTELEEEADIELEDYAPCSNTVVPWALVSIEEEHQPSVRCAYAFGTAQSSNLDNHREVQGLMEHLQRDPATQCLVADQCRVALLDPSMALGHAWTQIVKSLAAAVVATVVFFGFEALILRWACRPSREVLSRDAAYARLG
mmetsp:Transcript_29472/g.66633  ORF Transcript_29472/g.66633 Transcript_29472/m.66633 type:complete len:177 (+) Transcript_29472:535-1065(+)